MPGISGHRDLPDKVERRLAQSEAHELRPALIAVLKTMITNFAKLTVRNMTISSSWLAVCWYDSGLCKTPPDSSQKHRRPVKWVIVLLVLGLSQTHLPIYAAEEPSQKSLLTFWRSVFLRPADGALQDNVSASKAVVVALGEQLFGDTRLSGKKNRSCVSCHDRARGFSDGRKRGLGIDGLPLKRNTPTLYNVTWGKSFNWDGRSASLEEQMLGPILHKNELAGAFSKIIPRLKADATVKRQFANAFPENPIVSQENIIKALAAFERSIVSPETLFDRWISGDEMALNASEKSGFKIFVGKGGCVACHSGWRFTNDGFHDIGLATTLPFVSREEAGKKGVVAFKTPTLRSVLKTGPYMHDGSMENLVSVVEHYSDGIVVRKGLDALLQRNLKLTMEEKANLVAFLETL